MGIVISLNDAKLRDFLDSRPGSYHYVYSGKDRKQIDEFSANNALKRIDLADLNGEEKDRFRQAYVDLVGELGRKHDSLSWWATNTSAKNQFGSKLFENLYLYYFLIRLIRLGETENLLIINPPGNVYRSLAEYLRTNKLRHKLLGSPSPLAWNGAKSLARYCIAAFLFMTRTLANIHTARKYMSGRLSRELDESGSYPVIRTWFFGHTLANQDYSDSFFGVLPSYLADKGKKPVVLAGIMGEYKPIVARISLQKGHLIFPLELFLKYSDLPRTVLEILFHRVSIREQVKLDDINVTELVKKELQTEFSGAGVMSNYLNYYCIRNLLRRIRIRNFIVIYECNAWERMCILALRKYSPYTCIIGYQHPPLFEAAVNMMMSPQEKGIMPMPDKINTIGKVNKEWLEKHGNYDGNLVSASCALRMEIGASSELAPRKGTHSILLVLGGVRHRAIDLLNFAAKGMGKTTGYSIIVRSHPELPLRLITGDLGFDLAASGVFMISCNASVRDDLQEADAVLYDASTIALQALYMGIPVIHIGLKDILSFDPLPDCRHLKWTVTKEEELLGTIEAIYRVPEKEFQQQQRAAQTYVEDYVYPCTEERLSEFIV